MLFEVRGNFAARGIGFVRNGDADFESSLCGRFGPQVLDEPHTAEDDALAHACEMRKQAMLDRVVFGRIRRIVCDADRHAYLLHDLCQVLFEQIGACAIAPTSIAQEQERIGLSIDGASVVMPPLASAITGKCTRVMARAQSDIAMILPQIVNSVGNDDPFGQTWKVMIERLNGFLGIQGAWAIEIAN